MDIIAMMQDYIKPELLIITPVLYVIAKIIDGSHLKNDIIPWVLLLISIVLAGLYTFATTDITTIPKLIMAIFVSLVQGVLLSGTAIFGGIIGNLMKKRKES